MSQGLQVWNAASQLVLDLTDRVLKSVVVETVVESGTEVIPHSGADGTSAIVAVVPGGGTNAPAPAISVGGGNVTVAWGSEGRGGSYSREVLILEY
ncbi:MAG: hypothetical protein Q8L84_03385 [Hyphomonas sp.]|nr:hypothetical protein [Hyphomonas sp.]